MMCDRYGFRKGRVAAWLSCLTVFYCSFMIQLLLLANKYIFGVKIVKFGPVDPEIIWLKLKKKEITEGKIYSPVGKFAELAK